MKTKKLFAVLLLASFIILSICSCGSSADAVIAKANSALHEQPFSVTVSFDVESESDTIDTIINALNAADVSLHVDGDNAKVNLDVDVLGSSVGCEYVLFNGVLYSQTQIGALGAIKQKATLEREDIEKFFENSVDLSFIEEFGTYEIVSDGDTHKINCTDAANDYKEDLLEDIEDEMKALDFDITVDNAELEMVVEDNKYQTMCMTASYTFSHGDESFAVTFNYRYKFEYGNRFAISEPTDIDSYTEVDFDKIFDIG